MKQLSEEGNTLNFHCGLCVHMMDVVQQGHKMLISANRKDVAKGSSIHTQPSSGGSIWRWSQLASE